MRSSWQRCSKSNSNNHNEKDLVTKFVNGLNGVKSVGNRMTIEWSESQTKETE
jgi:hypothetical protein